MKPDAIPYMDNLIDTLNEAVFVYDESMKIRHFNSAAEKITGFTKDEVIGKECVTLFDKSLCLNNCALCQTVKNGVSENRVQFESPFMRRDGVRRQGRFQAGLLKRDANGRVEVLVALTDTTEIARLKEKIRNIHTFQNIVGKNHHMQELFQSIANIAQFDTTVLIQGESGTGKELVAKAIHHESPRARKKLIAVHCSSFSESLLESELFGHVKGAFTGAVQERMGRFEEGCGGTVFLDEVGDLSPQVQVKLLRVLQEKEIQRVGENKTRKVDIRILAATHKDLMEEIRTGRFRQDLYYRLNVVPIQLPALRTRKDDIPLLADYFIQKWTGENEKAIESVTYEALGSLMDYDWPGNVRELENALEHACVKCTGKHIELKDLPAFVASARVRKVRRKRTVLTREKVEAALQKTGHNQTQAAQLLNVHRITLWRKMKAFNLDA